MVEIRELKRGYSCMCSYFTGSIIMSYGSADDQKQQNSIAGFL